MENTIHRPSCQKILTQIDNYHLSDLGLIRLDKKNACKPLVTDR